MFGLDHPAHTPVSATAQTPSRSGSAKTPSSCWFASSTSCGKPWHRDPCVPFGSKKSFEQDLTSITGFYLTASSPSHPHQSSGADGRHPEAADGTGVHAGVQRRAQSRPRAPQEHPGQGGAEEAAALHQLAQAAGCPRRLGQVNADGVSKLAGGAGTSKSEDVVTEKLSCVIFRPGTLHDFRSHEIADQLTLLDAELFYKIEVRRLLRV